MEINGKPYRKDLILLPDGTILHPWWRNPGMMQPEQIVEFVKQEALLHEFRACLVFDVVTGKIDVRSIEIPDFKPAKTAPQHDNEPNDELASLEEAA